MQPPQAAYVHLPFCRRRCGYCNFTVVAGRDDLHARYVAALASEMRRTTSAHAAGPRTVYLGGGTPSQTPDALLEQILAALRSSCFPAPWDEFTIEANPEDVTRGRAERWAALGATRVSLGVQSLNAAKLRVLERDHSPSQADAAVRTIASAGMHAAVDLIFAAPHETVEQWRDDLRRVIDLQPSHISTYGLTYEKGAAFWGKRRRGSLKPIPESEEAEMYEQGIATLTAAGFEHYEVSNFAKPGRRSGHNLAYWTGRTYYGFGAGAARHIDARRAINHRSAWSYMRRVEQGHDATCESEQQPLEVRMLERLVFGLRLRRGVGWTEETRRQWRARVPRVANEIDALQIAGLLQADAQRLWLTTAGLMVADSVASRLLG